MGKYLIFAYQGNPEIYRWHLVEDKNTWQEISSLVKWLENDTLTIEIFQIEEVSPDDLLEWPENISMELEPPCEKSKRFYFICGEEKEILLVGFWINYPWWIENAMSFYVNIYKNDDVHHFLRPSPVYTWKERRNAFKDLHNQFKIHKIFKKKEKE